MHDIDIHRLDLNLLKVFLALYETRSVTAAAERVGLAQSSLSHALGRLRTSVGDQLFVRSTIGMQPTPYAEELAGPVTAALGGLKSALMREGSFDPALSTKVFNLVMTDVCELMFLPRLVGYVERAAPNARIAIHQMPRSMYRAALEDGTVDLALGQIPAGQTDFFQRHLFEERFSCVMRPGHRLENALTLEAFLAADHAAVGSPAVIESLLKRALKNKAAERRVLLHVPHYMVVPFVVAESDLLAVLPQTVSRTYARLGILSELPLPFEMEPVVTRQFWHPRTHSDPSWTWLRGVIADLFSSRADDQVKDAANSRPRPIPASREPGGEENSEQFRLA